MDDEQLAPTAGHRIRTKRAGIVVAAGIVSGLALATTTALGSGSASAAAPVTSAAAKPVAAIGPATTPSVDPQDAALAAFFAAGYTYDDAVALAGTWHSTDAWEAKATAGKKLENGETLPIAPGSSAPAPPAPGTADDAAVTKFFAAGYTYDDAVKLAKMWGNANAYEAKVAGGKKLENGETLPIAP